MSKKSKYGTADQDADLEHRLVEAGEPPPFTNEVPFRHNSIIERTRIIFLYGISIKPIASKLKPMAIILMDELFLNALSQAFTLKSEDYLSIDNDPPKTYQFIKYVLDFLYLKIRHYVLLVGTLCYVEITSLSNM
ncbi:hypothetical protein HW555_007438 [Spodoptera exigua]|uniref:Uncharacterized protein n=1 Tax=Spodoptera exigua TaxID=7107 RepID=A0A835GGA8_SPOEX|nr:hypothetical protein HW555_007438 [Spodoptera exigua]